MTERDNSRAYAQRLEVAFHDMNEAQENVVAQQLSGDGVDMEHIAEFERAVMSMQRLIRTFITTTELQQYWKKMQLGAIPQVCRREVVIERGKGQYGLERPDDVVIQHASVERLEMWASALTQIYSDLGFAPEAEESVQQTKIDDDLLKEVHAWRRENTE